MPTPKNPALASRQLESLLADALNSSNLKNSLNTDVALSKMRYISSVLNIPQNEIADVLHKFLDKTSPIIKAAKSARKKENPQEIMPDVHRLELENLELLLMQGQAAVFAHLRLPLPEKLSASRTKSKEMIIQSIKERLTNLRLGERKMAETKRRNPPRRPKG